MIESAGRLVLSVALVIYAIAYVHVGFSFALAEGWTWVALGTGIILALTLNPSILRKAGQDPLPLSRLASVLAYVTALVVFEEIVYRGCLYPILARFTPALLAAAIVTTIFAASHQGQGWRGIATHFVTGGAFVALFIVSGSLVPSIIAHLAYNALLVVLSRFPGRIRNDQITTC